MREHMGLFKGKRKDNKEWVEGYYVRLYDLKGHISHRIYIGFAETECGELSPRWYEVDPDTLCEYSGETDSFGNQIFEGDIVHCMSTYDSEDMVVVFEEGEFRMASYEKFPSFRERIGYHNLAIVKKEVIGNIHGRSTTSDDSIAEVELMRCGEKLFTVKFHSIVRADIIAAKYKATYTPNPSGAKPPHVKEAYNDQIFKSWVIYLATVEEDRLKLWDNEEIMKRNDILSPAERIDNMLTIREKNKLVEIIAEISGLRNLEELL